MREVRARLGCAALTLTLLLNLFPATAQAINSEYCPDGEPCTHEAAIGTTHYDTLEEIPWRRLSPRRKPIRPLPCATTWSYPPRSKFPTTSP